MKHSLLANGRRIVYYETGRESDGLPLVLIHGFCEDSSVWNTIMSRLGTTRVIRIDLPGFGGSDLPLAPGMEFYAEALCAVLNELGLSRCLLAGHSMGGYSALVFAQKYPERLAGLALIHSHPFEDSPERKENRRRGIGMLQSGKKDLYVAQLFPGLFAPDFAQTHPEVVDALIRQGQKQPDAAIIAALEGMIERRDHRDTLEATTCPVLFIYGELDAIIPENWISEVVFLPAVSEACRLTGVGHMGMFEAPELLSERLLRFHRFCEEMNRQFK